MDRPTDGIMPLDQLSDFEIADGQPDVRGWDVLSADGRTIGEVDNLLIDTAAMKVRYLDVDIDDDLLTDDKDRHILVQIGFARLDRDDDQIFLDSVNTNDLGRIPAYRHELLTPEYESSVERFYGSDRTVRSNTGPSAINVMGRSGEGRSNR